MDFGFFEIPIELRPCPDCGAALWGEIAVDRLPLTGKPGLHYVTGIDPRRVRTDGTPAVRQIQGLEPADVEAFNTEHEQIGWCPECQQLKPTKWD